MTKTVKCQFCGKTATKLNFKPSVDYPMGYDLCDHCASVHQKAWKSLKQGLDMPTDLKK